MPGQKKRGSPIGRSSFFCIANHYFFSLAGGTIPFIRRYSTSCPYSSATCTTTPPAVLIRVIDPRTLSNAFLVVSVLIAT